MFNKKKFFPLVVFCFSMVSFKIYAMESLVIFVAKVSESLPEACPGDTDSTIYQQHMDKTWNEVGSVVLAAHIGTHFLRAKNKFNREHPDRSIVQPQFLTTLKQAFTSDYAKTGYSIAAAGISLAPGFLLCQYHGGPDLGLSCVVLSCIPLAASLLEEGAICIFERFQRVENN